MAIDESVTRYRTVDATILVEVKPFDTDEVIEQFLRRLLATQSPTVNVVGISVVSKGE